MNLEHTSVLVHDARSAPEAANDDVPAAPPTAVEACLPFSGMTLVPAAYDGFARAHFHGASLKAVSWPDACPAYALAWLTHAAYGPELDEGSELELQWQWQDLQGLSNLSWREARAILRDAWAWLTRHERIQLPPSTGAHPHAQHQT